MDGKMKVAVMNGIGKMGFEERDIPTPKADEVLVKLDYVGICGSDLHYYETGAIGDYVVEPPFVLGHEPGGVVVEVGEDVTHLKVGDRVALEPGKTCGHCEFCKEGKYNLCPDVVFFATPPVDGVFQEYVAHEAGLCFKLPDNVSTLEGALIEPLAVGFHAAIQGDAHLGHSGGVDSSVAAMLLHKAIGKNLVCIFVDMGLLRKNEFEDVLRSYESMGLNVIGVRAGDKFLSDLKGVTEPENKRKIIGRDFIEVFDAEAQKLTDVKWLAQGTIYPDVIESVSVNGPSATIKSHHNVGGLPEKMHLKIVEPLRLLFKDEVRRVGRQLNIPMEILGRHPFPGPGLGIRILGEVTAEKVRVLQEADKIFIDNLKEAGLYDKVWQAGVMLLPVQSVGVMGDERTYENCVALRAVTSTDGMTADWVHLPYEFLAKVSNEIINRVKGINRVVYDISSKPPATIEWE